jgi:ribonuclease HII
MMITAGVDEVGRGPLAGPVIAAAVVLPDEFDLDGLTDSKKLSASKRNSLSHLIKQQALYWSIGRSEVAEIDCINIFHASLLAMKRAVESLAIQPDESLIDGKWAPKLACRTRTIIKGDLTEPSISAASIVAKVARDKEMCRLHDTYPGYGFDQNKGYATARHLEALRCLGACRIHRRSFAPVRRALSLQGLLNL